MSSKSCTRNWWAGRLLVTVLCLTLSLMGLTHAFAFKPASGFFEDNELQALGSADPMLLESPLAGVLVFRHDPNNYGRLQELQSWATQRLGSSVPIYAIVVVEREELADVVEEILSQRQVTLPVFVSSDNLLEEGRPYQLLVVRKDRARQVPDFDLEAFAKQLERYATDLGLTITQPAKADAATTRVQTKNPLYVNQQYGFRIRWPKNWDYKIARNGDGAVGVPPADVPLEARVWAAPEIKSSDPTDPPAYVQIKDYLNYVGTLAKGPVNVEKKLKVFDGDIEGRDYTYSYVRAAQGDKPEQLYRGRIQAFVVDGVGKLVCVEGPASVFDQQADLIDKFIYSFRPTLE